MFTLAGFAPKYESYHNFVCLELKYRLTISIVFSFRELHPRNRILLVLEIFHSQSDSFSRFLKLLFSYYVTTSQFD